MRSQVSHTQTSVPQGTLKNTLSFGLTLFLQFILISEASKIDMAVPRLQTLDVNSCVHDSETVVVHEFILRELSIYCMPFWALVVLIKMMH